MYSMSIQRISIISHLSSASMDKVIFLIVAIAIIYIKLKHYITSLLLLLCTQ